MEIDPLQEIRRIRERISRECDNDADKVFDFYQRRQDELKASGSYTIVKEPLVTASEGAGSK